MSNKKGRIGVVSHSERDPIDAWMKVFGALMSPDSMSMMFGGLPQVKEDENDLGRGFRLVPIEYKEGKRNVNNYSYLYKDGVKISDTIFRRGGFGGELGKNDFFQLIAYPTFNLETYEEGASWGNQSILNLKGEIVLQAKSFIHLYYHRGVIASIDSLYYNLLTGEPIVKGGQHSMSSESFLFIENSYNKEYPLGVYKIEYATGKFEIFN